ncbi:MAG TPA: hypothetical protein VHF25_06035 [Nitriliruptorales bacterium]|nr:hypothetical protein [Nitriliruptorales bacterium]
MRGDLALQLRVALRPRGVVGVGGAFAGLAGVIAVYLPWYALHADVTMLGSVRSRAVAALTGWQAHPWVWLVAALGVVATIVGLSVAADRPIPASPEILFAAAIAMSLTTGASALVLPPTSRFGADEQLVQLASLADAVPDDVSLGFSVHHASGVWVALAAAALLLVTAFTSRRL